MYLEGLLYVEFKQNLLYDFRFIDTFLKSTLDIRIFSEIRKLHVQSSI